MGNFFKFFSFLLKGVKSLEVWLCATGTNEQQARAILDPQTDIFLNLEELKVTDHSGYCNEFPKFSGLYKNCRNIRKLTLETSSRDFEAVLGDVLPHLVELNEIHLTFKMTEHIERILREKCQQQSVSVFMKHSGEERFFEILTAKSLEAN